MRENDRGVHAERLEHVEGLSTTEHAHIHGDVIAIDTPKQPGDYSNVHARGI